MPPKPQPLPAVTSGPINRVPCCNCGKPNSFAGMHEMLDTGLVVDCDHCHRPMQVAAIQTVKVISVRAPRGPVTRIKSKG
jgi:hypothetical protein